MVPFDRIRGSLFGGALGDALGYPVEFDSRAHILERHGPHGVRSLVEGAHPAGFWSDDTQMTLALLEGLVDVGPTGSLDDWMEAIGRRFVAWSHAPDNDRAPGRTCMTGCAALEAGVPWRQAGVAGSKGCGSAMRVAPIGLVFDDPAVVGEVARASSLLTHGHPAAVEGAAAAALLVHGAARGLGPEALWTSVWEACSGRDQAFDLRWQQVRSFLGRPAPEALSASGLGEAWVAEEAVAGAMWLVWTHFDTPVDGLLAGANTDGDSDSLAAIAGGVLGAAHGMAAFPTAWCDALEAPERLEQAAHHALAFRIG